MEHLRLLGAHYRDGGLRMEAFFLYLITVVALRPGLYHDTWAFLSFAFALILTGYLYYSWRLQQKSNEYNKSFLSELQAINSHLAQISRKLSPDANDEDAENKPLDAFAKNVLEKINDGSYSLAGIAISLNAGEGDIGMECLKLYKRHFIHADTYERIMGVKPPA